MSATGQCDGDVCNRNGCKGVMREQETDTCCSCHINPPCSHCTNAIFECEECGEETEVPGMDCSPSQPMVFPEYKTNQERFNELEDGKFDYVTIPGKYYWMEYWGKMSREMTGADVVSKFNTCFGYRWIKHPSNGVFHIKVYTD